MSKLRISLSCGDYDRTRFLINGTVEAEGLDITVIPLASAERHDRFSRNLEFDVCELQLGLFLGWKSRGAPFTAIPIFPNRGFCHGNLVVRTASGIEEAKELQGKTLGMQAHFNPVAVWIRGILKEEHGVDLATLKLRTRAREQVPGWHAPDWLDIERLPKGMDIDDALLAGLIDAYVLPTVQMTAGESPTRRLWHDHRAVERDYVQRTGIFPLRHTVVIRNELLDEYPWVALSLYKAFDDAMHRGIDYMLDERRSYLAWYGAAVEDELAILGGDPYVNGVEANRIALETVTRYAFEAGITDQLLPLEEMFAASTLGTHQSNRTPEL